jgi:hypothetical protein
MLKKTQWSRSLMTVHHSHGHITVHTEHSESAHVHRHRRPQIIHSQHRSPPVHTSDHLQSLRSSPSPQDISPVPKIFPQIPRSFEIILSPEISPQSPHPHAALPLQRIQQPPPSAAPTSARHHSHSHCRQITATAARQPHTAARWQPPLPPDNHHSRQMAAATAARQPHTAAR